MEGIGDADLRRLRIFLAVANGGSMSAGGKALGIKRSSVRSAIDTLEHRLGVELIQRSTTGITLTTFGKTVAQEAESLLQSNDAHFDRIRSISAPETRPLKIGSIFGFQSEYIIDAQGTLEGHSLLPTVFDMHEPAQPLLCGAVDLSLIIGTTDHDDQLDYYEIGKLPRIAVTTAKEAPNPCSDTSDIRQLDQLEWPALPTEREFDRRSIEVWLCADVRGSLPPKQSPVHYEPLSLRSWTLEGGRVFVTTPSIAAAFSLEGLLQTTQLNVEPWPFSLVAPKGTDLDLQPLLKSLTHTFHKNENVQQEQTTAVFPDQFSKPKS